MTFMLTYSVEGNPIGKGRPKFARRGNFVSTYTPTKTRDYETVINEAATTSHHFIILLLGGMHCNTWKTTLQKAQITLEWV